MEILVFKTNVEDKTHLRRLFKLFRTLQGVLNWNVDLHDHDKVLRMETVAVSPRAIETALQQAGYFCKELED